MSGRQIAIVAGVAGLVWCYMTRTPMMLGDDTKPDFSGQNKGATCNHAAPNCGWPIPGLDYSQDPDNWN